MANFRITGPGKYKRRNGSVVDVTAAGSGVGYPWKTAHWWHYDDGRVYSTGDTDDDIVEGPMSVHERLTGFTAYEKSRDIYVARELTYATAEAALEHTSAGGRPAFIIDLDKVPPEAIILPGPRTVTRKVWINVYSERWSPSTVYPTKAEADSMATSERIACIEREITFAEGEGLS